MYFQIVISFRKDTNQLAWQSQDKKLWSQWFLASLYEASLITKIGLFIFLFDETVSLDKKTTKLEKKAQLELELENNNGEKTYGGGDDIMKMFRGNNGKIITQI